MKRDRPDSISDSRVYVIQVCGVNLEMLAIKDHEKVPIIRLRTVFLPDISTQERYCFQRYPIRFLNQKLFPNKLLHEQKYLKKQSCSSETRDTIAVYQLFRTFLSSHHQVCHHG